MLERRNPLPKNLERRKKQELAKSKGKQIDKVYALAVGPEDEPIFFYVGIAVDTEKRWAQHQRAIKLGIDPKPAYEWVRYHKQADTCRMVVLDAEGELTERDWYEALLEAGYPLQNSAGTVDVRRKKRKNDDVTKDWRRVNGT